MSRPRVFMTIAKNGAPIGNIVIELWTDLAPKTAENFKCLCTGEKGKGQDGDYELCYKGAPFHRIIPGFMVQSGNFINGTDAANIYTGRKFFDDETFAGACGRCDEQGLLCMANRGPNTNRSGFFITTKGPLPHLDGKHVVFGRVVEGYEIVKAIEACGSPTGQATAQVIISDCGLMQ